MEFGYDELGPWLNLLVLGNEGVVLGRLVVLMCAQVDLEASCNLAKLSIMLQSS